MTFIDSFQEHIWNTKYKYKDETFEGFCNRIASNIFSKNTKRRQELYEYLINFEVLFAGRINANIGIEEEGLTLFNCYILSTSNYDMDSLDGILDLAKDYALTLKSEGGVGFCANFLRPAKTLIRKVGVSTPGAIKFLEVYDKISEVITSGSVDKDDSFQGIPTKSSIRKGATMVTLSVNHPDIFEFIKAKSVPNRLTKMNMSVLVTDAFMYAVDNDLDWDLWFPDIKFDKYGAEWDGSFEKWAEKGYPCVTYKTVRARELWDLLLRSSYSRNEPGILFIDTIRKYNNLSYLKDFEVNCTNPCQPGWAPLQTPFGVVTINDISVGDKIWSTEGWTTVVRKKLAGVKKVYKYSMDYNIFYGTENHKVVSFGDKKEVNSCTHIDCFVDREETTDRTAPFKINKIGFVSEEEVYDITVDNKTHTYDSGGCNVVNCGEVPSVTGKTIYNNKEVLLGDVCDLGSVNVVRFYDMKTKAFDFKAFSKRAALMVRALDNIIDISNYPLEQYELSAKLRRKIGVGYTGIGSLMMMMNIRYGSPESLVFSEKLFSVFINTLYRESALLAKEKGPFELYSKELLKCGYLKLGVLDQEVIDLIKQYGLRNSALSAIAPNGSLAILAGNVSGGVEPVFSKEFYRWNRIEGRKVSFEYPNIHKGEWFETNYFKEVSIGDEIVLVSKDGDYRVDKNVGLCERVLIKDFGYKLAEEFGLTETAGATELTVDEHLNILKIANKYTDLSCSKTINLSSDISFEDFKEVYSKIYHYGIKGCTTYKEGSTVAVLETQKKEQIKSIKKQQKEFLDAFKNQNGSIIVEQDIKLPDVSPSLTYKLKSEGRKWYLNCCFKDKECTKPFALFVNTNHKEDNVPTFNALDKLEVLARTKNLKDEYIEKTKAKYAYQKNPVKICRMLGLLLRHNVAVYDIVKVLDDVDGATVGTFVFRIKKFLAQFIQEHDIEPDICPNCKERALIFTEGCMLCQQCGHSKCS